MLEEDTLTMLATRGMFARDTEQNELHKAQNEPKNQRQPQLHKISVYLHSMPLNERASSVQSAINRIIYVR